MKWINRLYIFFLGIILTITTGFGIAAFYPQPVAPLYPSGVYTSPIPESCNASPKEQASPECRDILKKQQELIAQDETKRLQFEQDMRSFENNNASYTRTAIFLGIVIGTIFALTGIIFIQKSKSVANGLLLAGVLTAILTRLLINLASLGASATGTARADNLSFIEFGVLTVLSVLVIIVGQLRLTDLDASPRSS